MRPSSLSLSLSSSFHPRITHPVLPRFGVNRAHLRSLLRFAKLCSEKYQLGPTVGYRDFSRVSDRKRLDVSPQTPQRWTNRAAKLDGNVPPRGERISPSNPREDLLRHRRSAYKSPVPGSQYVPRSTRKILAARSPRPNGWRVYEGEARLSRN